MDATQGVHERASNPLLSGVCSLLVHMPKNRLYPGLHWTQRKPPPQLAQLAIVQAAGPVARAWGATVNGDAQQTQAR
jgi:hypothetical protein